MRQPTGPRRIRMEQDQREFWVEGQALWGDGERLTEGAYALPFTPSLWRRGNTEAKGTSSVLVEEDDARALDKVRERALAGDDRALLLMFRARRAPGKGIEPAGRWQAEPPLPPEVAAAMIEAGLAALGEPTVIDIPHPAPKGTPDRAQLSCPAN